MFTFCFIHSSIHLVASSRTPILPFSQSLPTGEALLSSTQLYPTQFNHGNNGKTNRSSDLHFPFLLKKVTRFQKEGEWKEIERDCLYIYNRIDRGFDRLTGWQADRLIRWWSKGMKDGGLGWYVANVGWVLILNYPIHSILSSFPSWLPPSFFFLLSSSHLSHLSYLVSYLVSYLSYSMKWNEAKRN